MKSSLRDEQLFISCKVLINKQRKGLVSECVQKLLPSVNS